MRKWDGSKSQGLCFPKSYRIIHIQKQQMNISKLILLAIIPLICCQGGLLNNFNDSVSTIRKSLSQKSLIGNWKLVQDSNFVLNRKISMINEVSTQIMRNNDKISFISSGNSQKQVEAYFDSVRSGSEPKSLYIELYDGKYYKNNTVALEIDLKNLELSHRNDGFINLWNNTKPIIVVCMLIENKEIIGQVSMHAKIQIYSNAQESNLNDPSNNYMIKFESDTFSFYAELKSFSGQYDRFVKVHAMFTFLFLVALIFFKPKRSLYNISQWMILQAFAFVVVSSWIFITVSLEKIDTKLKYVALCSFINICLSFFFLRNYEEVLKSFQGKYQRIASILSLLIYLYLCFKFEESLIFWILESYCLLALQVNYSYTKGGRGGLSVTLVGNLFIMRIPYFYYRFFCPQLTREPTDYRILGIFVTVNLAVLGFSILQRYFGSRFMIPKELIPDYFNYHQKFTIGDEILDEDCPICIRMLKLQSPLQQDDQNEEQQLQQTIQGQNRPEQPLPQDNTRILMVTPCEHHYHSKCLLEWMEKRLMCPKCRGGLPPSEGQRDDSYCC